MQEHPFDVIVIGGSYAGLSAALALGRSLRRTLVIDAAEPCNRYTPHAHNLLTHDGVPPGEIAAAGREELAAYPSVNFLSARAIDATADGETFVVATESSGTFRARRLIFATGVRDLLPSLAGFAACWGKSVIHCPYCHGYEFRHAATGILADGDTAYHYAPLIANLTDRLTVFTDGPSALTEAQTAALRARDIDVVQAKVAALVHSDGALRAVELSDGSARELDALYHSPPTEQHSDLPARLGCELTDTGHVRVDARQSTTVPGVFAAGDCTTYFRALSVAMAAGGIAGATANGELAAEGFAELRS